MSKIKIFSALLAEKLPNGKHKEFSGTPCIFLCKKTNVSFNPTTEGVQILWVGGGASEAPPKKSMIEWAETPCCYRHIVKV